MENQVKNVKNMANSMHSTIPPINTSTTNCEKLLQALDSLIKDSSQNLRI